MDVSADVLRVYDPAECDEHGVPLDWERCRSCGGTGQHGHATLAPKWDSFLREHVWEPVFPQPQVTCSTCGGHGSLRAAALDYKAGLYDLEQHQQYRQSDGATRCEGCGHPMSDGTMEDPDDQAKWVIQAGNASVEVWAFEHLRRGGESPERFHAGKAERFPVHWSPCDEGCRHGGAEPLRVHDEDGTEHWESGWKPSVLLTHPEVETVEASWRPVELRLLGWPHDLRPERLAVLCLRCAAARSAA